MIETKINLINIPPFVLNDLKKKKLGLLGKVLLIFKGKILSYAVNHYQGKVLCNIINFFYSKNGKIFYENSLYYKNIYNSKFYYPNARFLRVVNDEDILIEIINESYCLDFIDFSNNDIVIDCGANIGDLFIGLENLILPSNYIAVEPNPSDFKMLKLNTYNSILINKALGNQNKILPFYVATEDGDSSLVEPRKFDKIIDISVVRLDKIIQELKLKKIKLLKLEAEGYEPEILEGAGTMLEKFEYIAVDGGYERGPSCKQTFTTITNYLLNNGFEIKDIYFPWSRALFRRK